ncbi:HAD family hydrolase [Actinopolymorpha alba]|uniref:HAD family hydrolase n=1 Tax=Actinopolymorpha alba TaxID=533267 RepID=UPI000370C4DC|nr:HAD-IA family hydrolase [Actinopolymorpha alba]
MSERSERIDQHRAGAVIFDFFGTLSESASARERHAGHERVAAVLGVPVEVYADAVRGSWPDRARGRLGDLEATMRWLARACGVEPDDETCAAACAARRSTQSGYVRLRPDAAPTLRALKQRGVRVGLVSDCTHELPACWPTLPVAGYVDAPVFSVEVGVKKPDPAIYLLVCERLGVAPEDCVYVGDGDSNELPGAEAVGMRALRLIAPDHVDAHVIDPISWSGRSITALGDVLALNEPDGPQVFSR